MNNPIYKPKGKAAEYGDYALNIYTGCPHRCWYCFAPGVLHRDKEQFHSDVRPRDGIVEAVEQQLAKGDIKDKLIHLCFTCDPYPLGYDTTATREIIKLIKDSGNHVQILTKNHCRRDLDLLDENDWYGITLTGQKNENASSESRLVKSLILAHHKNIKTWVSFEPVLEPIQVFASIELYRRYIDKVKIGKLNYYQSNINWASFGKQAETLCKVCGVDYYIKESLRAEMEKHER